MARFCFSFAGVLLILHVVAATREWDFGEDVPGSNVVYENSGVFQLWDKVKEIHVEVPPCMELTYVRVAVDNILANPETTFNLETKVVTIKYKMLQSSISSYEVVAKAVSLPSCDRVVLLNSDTNVW